MTMHACYLGTVFNPPRLIDNAEQVLSRRMDQIDVFVGIGVSGTVIATILGMHFNRPFGIVRKPGVSSHSLNQIELGVANKNTRWLFVDDLICSGKTMEYVKMVMFEHGYRNYAGSYMAEGSLRLEEQYETKVNRYGKPLIPDLPSRLHASRFNSACDPPDSNG